MQRDDGLGARSVQRIGNQLRGIEHRMTRTANRHIVTDTVRRSGPKRNTSIRLGAKERHAGFDRLGGDARPGEVLAQVRANLRRNVDH